MKKCYFEADVLLPDFNEYDARKWAVVACDQFTSEPEYWEKAEMCVGDAPSTLKMMLPEVYLSQSEERIPAINAEMEKYTKSILQKHENCMIYVERTQSDESVRRGVVMAVDLECYDYTKGADTLIRATEATVIDRIPPRVAIRRGASVELPHVMLLIDDPSKTVIEPLAETLNTEKIYDFDLMLGGGHITGRLIGDDEKARMSAALDALVTPEAMKNKYGDDSLAALLFAVGDGNHSLASAKALYEEIKAEIGADKAAEHPARYALVEVVNIHDDALKFEPIYRIMTGVEPSDVVSALSEYAAKLSGDGAAQTVNYIFGDTKGSIVIENPEQQLTVGTLQKFIDEYISEHKGGEVDYIHGEDSVEALAKKENSIGFIFDGMEKSQLFKTVIFDGALPRKTFSMGHAVDKRYYLECRKIR